MKKRRPIQTPAARFVPVWTRIARFADNGQYNLRLCFKQEGFRGRPPARSRGPPTAPRGGGGAAPRRARKARQKKEPAAVRPAAGERQDRPRNEAAAAASMQRRHIRLKSAGFSIRNPARCFRYSTTIRRIVRLRRQNRKTESRGFPTLSAKATEGFRRLGGNKSERRRRCASIRRCRLAPSPRGFIPPSSCGNLTYPILLRANE